MFGWEYPPHISGGLGTACQGITKGLGSYSDIELTFVLPRAYGNEVAEGVKFVSASDVELKDESLQLLKKHEYYHMKEPVMVSCYISSEQYEQFIKKRKKTSVSKTGISSGNKIALSGKYGATLFDEIYKYSVVAGEIAEIEDFDIIHVHDWMTFRAGIEAKRISGKPLVVHVHATEFDRCGDHYNRRVFCIEQEGMKNADIVIAVSELTRNTVINKYGIPASKVHTVYNAADAEAVTGHSAVFKKGINEKIVTFLGRITYQKGPEFFIAAAQKVLQKMANVRFVMAGNGDLSEKMIRYVASLGISDRFHFAGFLKGDDVSRMYAMSDLYIMPSVSEPFGISPLEALHSGVPVIISKQSGVSEIISHAIKIDFWDIDAMADAIYGILKYPSLANFLRHKGKEDVSRISWKDSAGKIRQLYYHILQRPTG
ncbi:MAG: glycosyltransferase [Bacteroidales bacterium]|nr:glycosyltransferase [Bacteroidales bacterium]